MERPTGDCDSVLLSGGPLDGTTGTAHGAPEWVHFAQANDGSPDVFVDLSSVQGRSPGLFQLRAKVVFQADALGPHGRSYRSSMAELLLHCSAGMAALVWLPISTRPAGWWTDWTGQRRHPPLSMRPPGRCSARC